LEEDRFRLAQKLQDSTSQNLAALKMNLGVIRHADAQLGPKAREALAECLALADACGHEARAFSSLLYPLLEEFGLASALRRYLEVLEGRCELRMELVVDRYFQRSRLPKELETALFRVAQEGLSNVRLHSGSKSAEVELRRGVSSGEVLLRVRDRGRGMAASVVRAIEAGQMAGCGISDVRERVRQLGGEVKVATSKRGTVLTAVLPLPNKRKSL
jgi:signal transduction histidine kinase